MHENNLRAKILQVHFLNFFEIKKLNLSFFSITLSQSARVDWALIWDRGMHSQGEYSKTVLAKVKM